MREAPSLSLIVAVLRAYDPAGMEQARLELPDIAYCDDAYAYACARAADPS